MEDCTDIRRDCDTRFEVLEAWQRQQNGTLTRLETKIDGVEAKIDKVLWSVVGGLGAVILALIAAILSGALS